MYSFVFHFQALETNREESKQEIKAKGAEIEKLKKELQYVTMEKDENILLFEVQVQNQQKQLKQMKAKKVAVPAMPVGEFLNLFFDILYFSFFPLAMYKQSKYYLLF